MSIVKLNRVCFNHEVSTGGNYHSIKYRGNLYNCHQNLTSPTAKHCNSKVNDQTSEDPCVYYHLYRDLMVYLYI